MTREDASPWLAPVCMIDMGGPDSTLYSFLPNPFNWSDQSHLNNTLSCFRTQLPIAITQGLVTEPQEGFLPHPSYSKDCLLNRVVKTF